MAGGQSLELSVSLLRLPCGSGPRHPLTEGILGVWRTQVRFSVGGRVGGEM